MAVTKQNRSKLTKLNNEKNGLSALTLAALTLPGLSQSTDAVAYEDEASFSYGHYQEGKRDLAGATSAFSPVEVESLQGSGKFKLSDRIKFAFNYQQDTWGGATPVATAPLSAGGNGTYIGQNNFQTVTGATPYLKSGYQILLDKNSNALRPVLDANGSNIYDVNGLRLTQGKDQFVHTMAQASPEVRKQGDFKLSYEWDEAALDIGGGISIEDDYESRFGNINTRWDFNQKQTTLNVGLSYTNSDTHAILDHDAVSYIEDRKRVQQYSVLFDANGNSVGQFIDGTRQDWSANLGLTQILNKNALVEASLAYTRSTGYMANPYKAVSLAIIDPEMQVNNCPEAAKGLLCANLYSLLEQRPEVRNQWNGSLRYVQHIDALGAAIHAGYRIFSDDWGITSHTFDADWVQPLGQGWSITPRIRYYSQDAADFYTPMLSTNQALQKDVFDSIGRQVFINQITGAEYYQDLATGEVVDEQGNSVTEAFLSGQLNEIPKKQPFDRNKLSQHFSSDHRLSGYGALSGGVTVTKQFAKGVAVDLGFEYYTHQGSLKIGGGGENSFADFDYWTANAALRVDLEAMSLAMADSIHDDHTHHHEHSAHAPAGVMFDHMLPKAGDWMMGYRYMYSSQGGTMLNGIDAVGNAAIVSGGCGSNTCVLRPNSMSMHMHMLDLMYAPTDWLTLMLMPQFMDMSMNMSRLRDQSFDVAANNNVGNPIDPATGSPTDIAKHIPHHIQNGHETGGIGDLGMYALIKLFDNGIHHLHITPGFSAPTGDVDIQLRRNHQVSGGFIHYGMQLGSGTWDFKPSLTYTGHIDQFSWGAQASGTIRMETKNKSGFAFGDILQATAWGGYDITHWLTASVRGVYTTQGAVKGGFKAGSINQFGTMDYPQNYGGKFWDVGFGLSAMVPSGVLMGNRVSVEWLQPVYDNANGYQQERDGTLSATWSLMF